MLVVPAIMPTTIFKFILVNTIFLILLSKSNAQQQQDPTKLNGGSILAMAGENCIAIVIDKRFGSGPQMINISPRTVLTPHSRVMIGLVGLEGDVQSLSHDLSAHISAKMGRHLGFDFGQSITKEGANRPGSRPGKRISPKSTSTLLSHLLYSRRNGPYYVEPIVAGLEEVVEQDDLGTDAATNECGIGNGRIRISDCQMKKYKPFLCAQDLIGAQSKSSAFVCSGAASKSLYGCAEALWRPNLKPEELLHICGRAFLSALERDCLSGYGAILYLMEGGKGIQEFDLSCRND